MLNRIHQATEQRKTANLSRQQLNFSSVSATELTFEQERYVNFSSNDYLGLATRFDLASFQGWMAKEESGNKQHLSSGAMSSPLVIGDGVQHKMLKDELLTMLDAKKSHQVMLFSSGFAANQGVLNALFNQKCKDSVLLQDRTNHASLLEAGRQLHAAGQVQQQRFKHNDVTDLKQLLNRFKDKHNKLVVTEGVFSMDGDCAPINELQSLCKDYDAWLMVDDAHGFGFQGNSLLRSGIDITDIDIYVVTFGKAVGAQGAAVIAKPEVVNYLQNFSKEYIYSTHLSPLQAAAVRFNLSQLNEQSLTEALSEKVNYFKQSCIELGIELMPSETAIQPVLIGDEAQCLKVCEALKAGKFWTTAIRYPTVPKAKSRLRITISAMHNYNEIKAFCLFLQKVMNDVKQQYNVNK